MEEIDDSIKARIRVLALIATIILLVILTRLWMLQGVLADEYQKLSEDNRIRRVSIDAPRGLILDRHGEPLVKNRLSVVVTLELGRAKDNRLIKRLARVLKMSVHDIREQIRSNKTDPIKPRVIQRDVSRRAVAYIYEHSGSFSGVELKVEAIRDYPGGQLAAHIVGYLGELSESERKDEDFAQYELGDKVGKTGIERTYDSLLAGSKGTEFVEVNAIAQPLRVVDTKDPDPGNDIVLTIDKDIQVAAEKALAEGIARTKKKKYRNANAGAIVVLTPDGEVLAMASYPTYDPSAFVGGISQKQWALLTDEQSDYPLNNRAMMSGYPPGSTFKVVTAAAGYHAGVMSNGTTSVCRGRWTGLGVKWGKWCWDKGGHGSRNIVTALQDSCDTFFYDVGHRLYQLKGEPLQDWSYRLGLGAKTGIDLPAEFEGRVPTAAWKKAWNKDNPDNQAWFPGDTVNMAIGQGDILATPLQIASLYAGIAGDGNIYKPRVVKSIVGLDGREIRDLPKEKIAEYGLTASQMGAIKEGLRRVVTSGTAKEAFAGMAIPISGKTGTSEVFGKDDFAFFAAYAPSDDPRYVVAVVIEQGGHGGSAAAPTARQILDEIFKLEEANAD